MINLIEQIFIHLHFNKIAKNVGFIYLIINTVFAIEFINLVLFLIIKS